MFNVIKKVFHDPSGPLHEWAKQVPDLQLLITNIVSQLVVLPEGLHMCPHIMVLVSELDWLIAKQLWIREVCHCDT